MRRAARTDSNQTAIVEALRAMGCSVAITSALGAGFPDLVVGYCGMNLLLEVKDGDKPESRRKLTADEQRFLGSWKGTVCVVTSPADAVEEVLDYINGES